MICAWCSSDSPTVKWLISFVYGPPYQKTNSDFWTTLANFGDHCDIPWLCIGDFNAIIAQHDKLGGRPFPSFSRNNFSYFMNKFGMVDLGFSGNPYTWSNHRYGHSLIKERLDRCIATNQWIQHFPYFSITHLPALNSDHNPLLLDTSTRSHSLSLSRPFRFEEFWTRDPTCGVVINEAWSLIVSGSPAYCLIKKLKNTKQAIKHWNKPYFGEIQRKLDSTYQLLDITQLALPSDSSLALELHLKGLLNEYLIQEESLWKHKSRDLWLTCKDLNTRFFHTSTLIRRRRNAIDLLKSSTDGWIADRRSIGDCFISNFKTLFASTNPTASTELLDLFHCSVSDEDNNMLCAIPTEAEIHTALASLGASKAPGPDVFTALFYMKYWDSIKLTVLQAV
jgi:hypothetical protein